MKKQTALRIAIEVCKKQARRHQPNAHAYYAGFATARGEADKFERIIDTVKVLEGLYNEYYTHGQDTVKLPSGDHVRRRTSKGKKDKPDRTGPRLPLF